MSGRRAAIGVLLAACVAGIAALVAVDDGGGGSPPGSSSADRGPGGLSTLAALLELEGHDVERRLDPPSSAGLDPAETAVLLDPGELSAIETRALRSFLDAGGRLLIGGAVNPVTVRELAGPGLGATFTADREQRPLLPVAETAGVSVVEGGSRVWERAGGALPVLADRSGLALLAIEAAGEAGGRLLLISDTAPLTNGAIGDGDNVRLASNLAGPASRSVVFIEDVGDASASGIAALPDRWLWAAALLLVAGLTLIGSRVRRLGPADRPSRELPPPRRAYVDAIAGSLARTRSAESAVEPVREAALRRLRRIAGSNSPSPDMLARAGRSAGLTDEEIAALGEPLGGDRDAVLAGRALSKLWR